MSYFNTLMRKKIMSKKLSSDEGYTILELLVVLVIISLIIGLAGPAIIRQFGSAKSKTASIEVNRLKTNLEFFRVDIGRFPTTEEGLQALVTQVGSASGWNGPYVDKVAAIVDPWGNPYLYTVSEDGDTIEVKSLGADGVENGAGEDADVSSLD